MEKMQAQLTDSQTMLKNTKNSLGSEKKQSNHVDTVSGATFSSTGIIKSVGQALEKAETK